MRKALVLILIVFVFLLPLSSGERTIVHISDIHYLSPSLFDYEALRSFSYHDDGKATHITPSIMESFIEEMVALSPEAVVVTGDLTYNGEKKSHEEMKAMFSILEESGIDVYVIMGNHDTATKPYALFEDGARETEGTTPMEGENLWLDFGYGDAINRDPLSSSYITELFPGLYLLAVDSNNGSGGTVRKGTLSWMDEALKSVKADGGRIISATHQNLFIHSSRHTFGYQINNSSKVETIYKEYGIKLNLSGHLHIQHITKKGEITEIAAEAFSDWPLQYGVITISDDFSFSYSTRELGKEELREEAQKAFDFSTEAKFASGLEDEETLDVVKKLNREYFRGYAESIDTSLSLPPEYKMKNYLEGILNDESDHRRVEGKL